MACINICSQCKKEYDDSDDYEYYIKCAWLRLYTDDKLCPDCMDKFISSFKWEDKND